MKFLPVQRIKFVFALCIIFGGTAQVHYAHTIENTQDIITLLTAEGAVDANDPTKEYLDILENITTLMREFVHDLHNNKKISYYIKELNKLVKELGEKAKSYQNIPHKHTGIHKRIYQLHKDFHEFIGIIKANETNPGVIIVKLLQKPTLKNIIPAKAEWTLENTPVALHARCKK